ncbi:AraC family transcriptional regulator [Caballeronia cordobensis]|uniref:AraC family transcriptional regulator n=1 Tax=Caballeronia cordobensis TaxID=1353886 RepID=A0A158IUU1_CABCO|nr:AraC family transcriptional regulator [Caballeronia cordobensis]SAL60275.1 AraC family transcriptional regulator [Caballeronia cordobensis]
MKSDAYGDSIARIFGLRRARSHKLVQIGGDTSFAATRLVSGPAGLPRSLPIKKERALIVVLQLCPLLSHKMWMDDRPKPVDPWPTGGLAVVDLEQSPSSHVTGAIDCIQFYFPRSGLEAIAARDGVQPIIDLVIPDGVYDPVVHQLARLMLPAMDAPDQANDLFLSGLINALHAHLARKYCGIRPEAASPAGALAPARLARAKDLISSKLSGAVSIAEVASECALSPAHFARAFKVSTGVAPHQWLLLRRVEVAKGLLRKREHTGAEIAVMCGFTDQSHLIRVFSSMVGTTPGEWQRRYAK